MGRGPFSAGKSQSSPPEDRELPLVSACFHHYSAKVVLTVLSNGHIAHPGSPAPTFTLTSLGAYGKEGNQQMTKYVQFNQTKQNSAKMSMLVTVL